MRKLSIQKLNVSRRHVLFAFVLGVVLMLCSMGGLDHKAVLAETTNCGTACSPHTPAVAIAPAPDQSDRDIEPAPPTALWASAIVGLAILYLAPPVATKPQYDLRKYLLTTHLRF